MGIRLLIYLHVDNMLMMSKSRDIALEHTAIAFNLLSTLGFVLNQGTFVLQTTQELQFLGFLANSITMSLPPKRQGNEYQERVSDNDRQPFRANHNTFSASGETVLTLLLSSDG